MDDLDETVKVVSAVLLALLFLVSWLYAIFFPVLFLFDAMPQNPWLIYAGYGLGFFSLFAWFIILNLVVRIVWYGGIYAVVYACRVLCNLAKQLKQVMS